MKPSRRKETLQQIYELSKGGENAVWREAIPTIIEAELLALAKGNYIKLSKHAVAITEVGIVELHGSSVTDITPLEKIEILEAIIDCGRDAKPETIRQRVGMNEQRCRQLLRAIEADGRYDGFAK